MKAVLRVDPLGGLISGLRGRILYVLIFGISCLCFSSLVQAQSEDGFDTVRIDTDLVNLNVSVLSRTLARATPSLEQKDFTVFEDGLPQQISFFASAQTPFDLVLLLDLSGSTINKLDLIRKSTRHFIDAARPTDRIAILTFTTDVRAVSLFTSDREALKKNVDRIHQSGVGGTNFWDSLRFVYEHVLSQSRAERRRSAIVVMTDGVDNALPDVAGDGSTTTFDELLKIVSASDALLLPIYLDTEKEMLEKHLASAEAMTQARESLAMLAAGSGNEIYRAKRIKDLDGVYEQVMRDLSTVYSIGYRSTNKERDGTWRGVSIQLVEHPDLAARSKRGYYAK